MPQLKILHQVPDGLWQTPARELDTLLDGPTIIHLPGVQQPPLFLSVLLHGNETSGWEALCRFMHGKSAGLNRSIILFIGNVRASAAGVRHLPDQMDFNRIWRNVDGSHGALAEAVLSEATKTELFAAIDLHNNTGHNPHYAVLTRKTPENLNLALLVSDRAVLVEEPDTVLTKALDDRCPAIAVELGPVGDPEAVELALQLLEHCDALYSVASTPTPEVKLYRALARVHIADDVQFGFDGDPVPLDQRLTLTGGMEAVNFHSLPRGSEFGQTQEALGQVLRVLDTTHADVTSHFFRSVAGRIELTRDVVPAMYTTDKEVVRQDCLCYLMEPFR